MRIEASSFAVRCSGSGRDVGPTDMLFSIDSDPVRRESRHPHTSYRCGDCGAIVRALGIVGHYRVWGHNSKVSRHRLWTHNRPRYKSGKLPEQPLLLALELKRIELGLNELAFAKLLGISGPHWSHISRGVRRIPAKGVFIQSVLNTFPDLQLELESVQEVYDGLFSDWSYNMAYALGYGFADGHLSRRPRTNNSGPHSYFTLSSANKEFLERLSLFIGLPNKNLIELPAHGNYVLLVDF